MYRLLVDDEDMTVSTFTVAVSHQETVVVSETAATRSLAFTCWVFRPPPASDAYGSFRK